MQSISCSAGHRITFFEAASKNSLQTPIVPGNIYLLNLPSAQTKNSRTCKMDEVLSTLKKYSARWSFMSTFTKSDEEPVY